MIPVTTYVMDACALIAYLRGEAGSENVGQWLEATEVDCIVHAINLCEVYYDFLRVSNEIDASEAIADLLALGLLVCEDMDVDSWRYAGYLKATQRLSLANCFAVALTVRLGGVLVTSDHHEFDAISAEGLCTIHFFR